MKRAYENDITEWDGSFFDLIEPPVSNQYDDTVVEASSSPCWSYDSDEMNLPQMPPPSTSEPKYSFDLCVVSDCKKEVLLH